MARDKDRHHLLFPKAAWNKTFSQKELRGMAIYTIPKSVHSELHRRVMQIPVLNEKKAYQLLLEYKKFCSYKRPTIFESLDFFVDAAPTPEFREAMRKQLKFFETHL